MSSDSENENVSLNGFSDEVGGEDGEGKGTRRESQHRGSGEEHRPTKLEFSKFNNVDIIHETNTLPNGFNMEDTPGKDGEEVACSPVEDDSLVTRLSRADVDMSKKVPQGERDAHNDINCVAKCIDPTNGWASVKNSTDKEREALKLTLKGMNCHDEDANGKCVDEKREAKRHGAIMNSASLKADPTTNKLSDCGKFLEKMEVTCLNEEYSNEVNMLGLRSVLHDKKCFGPGVGPAQSEEDIVSRLLLSAPSKIHK